MLTSPTPAERSMWVLTILSAISVNSRCERSPESASDRMGDWSVSALAMVGGSVSRGRSRTTVATRSRTSWAAASMSRPNSKVTTTKAEPDPLTERSSCMPSMVLRTSSIG